MRARVSGYGLPRGYRRNTRPADYDDHAEVTGHTAGWMWQPDVYPIAEQKALKEGRKYLLDVGCGSGRRLMGLDKSLFKVGLDREEIIDQISNTVEIDDGDVRAVFMPVDLEQPLDLIGMFDHWDEVAVICSDVIEHMVDPTFLAFGLAEMVEAGASLVLSTPDRIRARGPYDMGPPANHHHVQEWTLPELVTWLRSYGLPIQMSSWTRSNDHEPDSNTCLVIAGSPLASRT